MAGHWLCLLLLLWEINNFNTNAAAQSALTDEGSVPLVDNTFGLVEEMLYASLTVSSQRGFSEALTDSETQNKKQPNSTMAPNSKFLNPHVDDATNLQFAIAAFGDDAGSTEGNKSKASEILSKLSEGWGLNGSSRSPKSLDDWRLIPFLNSLLKGNRNYKFKKI